MLGLTYHICTVYVPHPPTKTPDIFLVAAWRCGVYVKRTSKSTWKLVECGSNPGTLLLHIACYFMLIRSLVSLSGTSGVEYSSVPSLPTNNYGYSWYEYMYVPRYPFGSCGYNYCHAYNLRLAMWWIIGMYSFSSAHKNSAPEGCQGAKKSVLYTKLHYSDAKPLGPSVWCENLTKPLFNSSRWKHENKIGAICTLPLFSPFLLSLSFPFPFYLALFPLISFQLTLLYFSFYFFQLSLMLL